MIDKYKQRRRWQPFLIVLSLVMVPAILGFPALSQAASITVTTTTDELNNNGQCSLREAITNADANDRSGSTDCAAGTGNDTITFGVTGTITLNSELTISDPAGLTLDGPAGGLIISGNNSTRVFLVTRGATVTMKNLTINNGNAANGGGIFNSGLLTISGCIFLNNVSSAGFASSGGGAIGSNGTLTVQGCIFSGNSAAVGGGGIRSSGTLTVTDTTFSGNLAAGGSGVLSNGESAAAVVTGSTFSANIATQVGAGIFNLAGTLTVMNSTFSGNTAPLSGGGIYNTGTLMVTNSTFSGNSATDGGAIRNGAGTTILQNSILANSTAGNNCVGTIINGGNNIDDGLSCGWGANDGSLSSIDPQLGTLADNGGPTQTLALLPGSPAIDAVTFNPPNSCPSTDQRGLPRPVDGDGNDSLLCDIGAFEFGAHPVFLINLPLILKGAVRPVGQAAPTSQAILNGSRAQIN